MFPGVFGEIGSINGVSGVVVGTTFCSPQHPSISPTAVGQHNPCNSWLAHTGLSSQEAVVDEFKEGSSSFVEGCSSDVPPALCSPQQPSLTPASVGQHSPGNPRLAHPECLWQEADSANGEEVWLKPSRVLIQYRTWLRLRPESSCELINSSASSQATLGSIIA